MSVLQVVLLVSAAVLTPGNSLPSKELTMEQRGYKIEAGVLLDVLAKLMEAIEKEARSQTSLEVTTADTECFEDFTLTQLSELLNSTTGTSRAYAFIEPSPSSFTEIKKVHQQKDGEHETTLYDRLGTALYDLFHNPTSVWLNKVPCGRCVTELKKDFSNKLGPKPTLYIETLAYNETNINTVAKDLGCLAYLQGEGFVVKEWNWVTFSETFNTDSVCTEEIKATTSKSDYTEKKTDIERLLSMVQQLQKENDIKTWCDV